MEPKACGKCRHTRPFRTPATRFRRARVRFNVRLMRTFVVLYRRSRPAATITVQFADAQGLTRLQGFGRLSAHIRVFQQSPPAEQTLMFARLRYRARYPSVTLTYQTRGHRKSSYEVARSANPSQICWSDDGVGAVTIDCGKILKPARANGSPCQARGRGA
jgi:hypothetical protein